tara:strand:+ start:2790 stop:4076 length:1287 start_codon:yes stop_codon:yes gene_type:complete
MNVFRFGLLILLSAILGGFVATQLFNDSGSDLSEIKQTMIEIDARQNFIEQEFSNSEKALNQISDSLLTTEQSLEGFEIFSVHSQENIDVLESAIEKTQDLISKVEQNYLNTNETINVLKNELGNIEGFNTDLHAVIDSVKASVVVIEVERGPARGGGTGFVIDSYGHIITNYHVIEGGNVIIVSTLSGDRLSAELIGTDPSNDLAVLRISSDLVTLTPVEFADSSKVLVGDDVFAIGNPFGEDFSVTAGIVSAVDRNTMSSFTNRQILNVIQTDAPINPGNSGGPLFNLAGNVIGVNTSISGPIRGNVGLGFAVPSNTVKRFLPEMKIGEKIKHPQLGITGRPLNSILTEENPDPVRGVLVIESVGAALQAGIIAEDIIIKFNNVEVKGFTDLAAKIDQHDVGDEVNITVLRGSKEIVIPVTFIAWQ